MHTADVRAAHVYHRRLQWVGALGPISVAALSITAVYLGDLQRRAGMAVVGSITAGLPHLTVSWWLPMDHFWQLASTAVVISFVSLLESISIARALAEPQQEGMHPLNPNQELLGGCCLCHLGLAVSCIFCKHVTTSSASMLLNFLPLRFVQVNFLVSFLQLSAARLVKVTAASGFSHCLLRSLCPALHV